MYIRFISIKFEFNILFLLYFEFYLKLREMREKNNFCFFLFFLNMLRAVSAFTNDYECIANDTYLKEWDRF